MKLLLFATDREAKPTIERLKAKRSGEIYKFEGGMIAVCGIGIHAAQFAVTRYAPKVDEVWNLGIAGALTDSHPIGSIVQIEVVGKHLSLPPHIDPLSREKAETHTPVFCVGPPGAHLLSVDFPVFDDKVRASLGTKWDLVEMEGYGVAYAAHHLRKKCRLWKAVSDLADRGGRAVLFAQIDSLAEQLAEVAEEGLCALQ